MAKSRQIWSHWSSCATFKKATKPLTEHFSAEIRPTTKHSFSTPCLYLTLRPIHTLSFSLSLGNILLHLNSDSKVLRSTSLTLFILLLYLSVFLLTLFPISIFHFFLHLSRSVFLDLFSSLSLSFFRSFLSLSSY